MIRGFYGRAESFEVGLKQPSGAFRNATLVAGDFNISKDGGAFAQLASLPVQIGTSGVYVVSLTDTEKDAERIVVRWTPTNSQDFVSDGLVIDQRPLDGILHARVITANTSSSFSVNRLGLGFDVSGYAIIVRDGDGPVQTRFIDSNAAGVLTLSSALSFVPAVGDYVTLIPAAANNSVDVGSMVGTALQGDGTEADKFRSVLVS